MGLATNFVGELLGTFILVFFGCGAVASATLFAANTSLFQVAGIWGIGVTLFISWVPCWAGCCRRCCSEGLLIL